MNVAFHVFHINLKLNKKPKTDGKTLSINNFNMPGNDNLTLDKFQNNLKKQSKVQNIGKQAIQIYSRQQQF